LFCRKNKNVAKSKEVRTGWSDSRQIWQKLQRLKTGCFTDNYNDDDDDGELIIIFRTS
jgi:hypothetical protein